MHATAHCFTCGWGLTLRDTVALRGDAEQHTRSCPGPVLLVELGDRVPNPLIVGHHEVQQVGRVQAQLPGHPALDLVVDRASQKGTETEERADGRFNPTCPFCGGERLDAVVREVYSQARVSEDHLDKQMLDGQTIEFVHCTACHKPVDPLHVTLHANAALDIEGEPCDCAGAGQG